MIKEKEKWLRVKEWFLGLKFKIHFWDSSVRISSFQSTSLKLCNFIKNVCSIWFELYFFQSGFIQTLFSVFLIESSFTSIFTYFFKPRNLTRKLELKMDLVKPGLWKGLQEIRSWLFELKLIHILIQVRDQNLNIFFWKSAQKRF